MARIGNVVLAVVAAAAISQSVPAMAQLRATDASRVPNDRELAPLGLRLNWYAQAKINSARDVVTAITTDETGVYVQGSNAIASAFDSETGRNLWNLRLGAADRTVQPITTSPDLVFVTSGNDLLGVDKRKGTTAWKIRMPAEPSAPLTYGRGRIFVPLFDGNVYAMNLAKLKEVHDRQQESHYAYEAVDWRYQTSRTIPFSPVFAVSHVLFASNDKSVYSVTTVNRNLQFQFETDGRPAAPMACYRNSYVLYASSDFNVYCINVETGRVLWQFAAGEAATQMPLIIDEEAYVTCGKSGIVRLSVKTGLASWRTREMRSLLSVTPTHVYAMDAFSRLNALDRSTGQVLARISMPRFSVHVLNDRTDRVIMGTPQGVIVSMKETDHEEPIYHQNPGDLRLTPEFAAPTDADSAGMKFDPNAAGSSADNTGDSADSDSSSDSSSSEDEEN